MRIGRPTVVVRDGEARYEVAVDTADGSRTLWYSVPQEHAAMLSTRADAALAALLIPAMSRGEDIAIAGTVSERLYYSLSTQLQAVLRTIIPDLMPVRIHPADVTVPGPAAPGTATAFSGGIDSYCVVADHFVRPLPGAYRISHLVFNNVGSHGKGGARLFRERYERLQPATAELRLPFIPVDSNLDEFYRAFTFQATHTPRNASVGLLLQGGVGRYLYAASYGYRDVFIGPVYDLGHSDMVTLPLLSTEAMDAFSVGTENSRLEKVLRVAELPQSYDYLDICVSTGGAGNCSVCWKCMRVLVVLEIAGLLDRYARCFDLDAYLAARDDYIAGMLHSDVPFEIDIRAFAAQRGFRWPLRARAAAHFRRLSGAWRAGQIARVLRRSGA